ncbi:unnamed protein product [Calicophoron daubneyi]|uniref:Uncharacterized protein n=1 Tax=Calicophoron daubneyi TaxID=300641 RepID=A0AAV2TAU9_CALDB
MHLWRHVSGNLLNCLFTSAGERLETRITKHLLDTIHASGSQNSFSLSTIQRTSSPLNLLKHWLSARCSLTRCGVWLYVCEKVSYLVHSSHFSPHRPPKLRFALCFWSNLSSPSQSKEYFLSAKRRCVVQSHDYR